MKDCVFCKIVKGQISAQIVYEDKLALAIMDIGQVNPGHTLVISKQHVETMMDTNEDLAGHLFRVANRVAKAIEMAFSPDGMTILQANKPAGFQTVSHLHLHVLPRHKDDGVDLVWPVKNPALNLLAEYAAKLRKNLLQGSTSVNP
ncbi:HIT domain-containing protein (plasmid) [Roseibium aggregatum]|jgi:histidine triad (HIT) family protein|uniref:HIT family protein n=1 Tax=Roseibium aggregatum TaxID=187304 RepID=UPI001E551D4C|nr:HIT family protein [Roseibium aggregatum]UES59871.1 HIT domain-containing protein [Roseibium aggregatum]WJS05861.1 HIT family protein [Roseibium aggregatum]